MRIDAWKRWLAGAALILLIAGCASSKAGTAVAITDVGSVAGRWSGLLEMDGAQEREDFVELIVDKSGLYRAVASRTVGVMDAQGKVDVVSDGKMLLKGDRGARATGVLYSQAGQPQHLLVVEGTTPTGRRFQARLHPQR